jgi:hypothetical protein
VVPAALAEGEPPGLAARLQTALNNPSGEGLAGLLAPAGGAGSAPLLRRLEAFRSRFPDARWQVTAGEPLRDGRPTLDVSLSGTRQQGAIRFRLEASQRLAVRTEAGRIVEQEVVREQSLLRSGTAPLPVSIRIPDAVLTGSRYDVDVVFDEPLDGALAAGGLVSLTPQQWQEQAQPEIQLGPLGGGGLFKSVRAPLAAGSQNWAALLVHPDGIVSVSKRVRVVDDRAQLQP